jgi:hypothetical protein
MKLILPVFLALGLSAWFAGARAEREPAQPRRSVSLLEPVCLTPNASSGSASRREAGVNAARLEEYLSFHAQAIEGRGLASVMPWHARPAASQ